MPRCGHVNYPWTNERLLSFFVRAKIHALLIVPYNKEADMRRFSTHTLRDFPCFTISDMRFSASDRENAFDDAGGPFIAEGSLPLAGFRYAVNTEGLMSHTAELFGLQRLAGIRQLSYLVEPMRIARENGGMTTPPYFTHTRLEHVFDVAAIMTLMLENQHDISREEKNLARVAALTHDAFMPAGGELIKYVDEERFDENAHYPKLFRRNGWRLFADTYGLNEERLAETILNNGWTGVLLDLADKLAYVARDADTIFATADLPAWVRAGPERARLENLMLGTLHPCRWWESVTIRDGQVVVDDAHCFAAFLEARALLFRLNYANPLANIVRFRLMPVVDAMLRSGDLTADELIRCDDADLERFIEMKHGIKVNGAISFAIPPVIEAFATSVEAGRRKRELLADGCADVRIMDMGERIRPCLHFLVNTSDGPKPVRDALPQTARAIAKAASMDKPFHVIGFPNNL